MASTEVTITAALVAAIRGIAVTKLGFDDTNGNVKGYLFEYEAIAKQASYLMANVSSKRQVRCWAVDVEVMPEEFFGLGGLQRREYLIRIVGYYDVGVNGSGVLALRAAQRKIAAEIKTLTTNLSGTVDRVVSVSASPVSVINNPLNIDEDNLLVGEIQLAAEREHTSGDY